MSETTEERIKRRLWEEDPHLLSRAPIAKVMAEEIERLEERLFKVAKAAARGPTRYR